MKLRLAQPTRARRHRPRSTDLSYIRDGGDHIAIGALTRHRDVETSRRCSREHVPLLAHAASHVGDPQVRHRGTIGGSIAHADPASDLPATTLALGAHATSPRARTATREIAAADFYQGFLESALAADEMLTEIRVPEDAAAPGGASRSSTGAPRTGRSSAWPRGGATATPASALVNMGSTPVLATSVSSGARRRRVGRGRRRAGRRRGRRRRPTSTPASSTATHLAKVLTRRALEAATA